MVQQLKQLAVVLLTAYCLRQTSAKVPELSSNNSNVDFVFVKFNQVGGSSVMQLLLNLVYVYLNLHTTVYRTVLTLYAHMYKY